MAAVVWLPDAYDDLDDIRRYITRDRPQVAGQIAVSIIQATRRLSVFPRSGRVVSELERSDIREIFVDRYRIVYRVSGDAVFVLAVRHGARRLTDLPEV